MPKIDVSVKRIAKRLDELMKEGYSAGGAIRRTRIEFGITKELVHDIYIQHFKNVKSWDYLGR